MKRRVPDEFAPAITPGHELVDYRVTVRERKPRRGRHVLRLKIEYGSLPKGIWERAVAEGATREDLRTHPDVVWTHPPKSGLRFPTAVAFVDLLGGVASLEYTLSLLNDPLFYHWESLRAVCFSQAAVAADRGARSEEISGRLVLSVIFLSRVFAAKWLIADDTDHALYPIPSTISFPSDTRLLKAAIVVLENSVAGADIPGPWDNPEYSKHGLPFPSGCAEDSRSDARVFEEEDGYFVTFCLNWYSDRPPVGSAAGPDTSAQEFVDKLMVLRSRKPMPGSIRTLAEIERLAELSPPEAMAWVFADRWNPLRMWQELETRLPVVVNRLEGVLGSQEIGKRLLLLEPPEMIKQLRYFVRDALKLVYGREWKRDGLTPDQNGELARMWAKDGRRASDDFESYAETPLMSEVIGRCWGKCFQQIFEGKVRGRGPWTKKTVQNRLSRLLELRNVVTHSKWDLTADERGEIRRLSEDIQEWRQRLEMYKQKKSKG